jgi:pseudouridine synthase
MAPPSPSSAQRPILPSTISASTSGASNNRSATDISSRSDPEHRPTVLDLLKGVREYVYPVGRLDFDSEGLLILTNDGDLAATLTHPKHEVERVYEAQVLGVPDAHDIDRLSRGVVIEGRRTSPAQVELLRERRTESDTSILRVTIHEGRSRQVRKMADAIGHPVRTLKRVRIGPIADKNLPLGSYRELTAEEVRKLRHAGRSSQPTTSRSNNEQEIRRAEDRNLSRSHRQAKREGAKSAKTRRHS